MRLWCGISNDSSMNGKENNSVVARSLHHPYAVLVIAIILLPGAVLAGEGMWLLDALPKLPLAGMQERGLVLTPEQIDGLKEGVVLLSGGTASFVSPDGLLLTNHHVAYSAIQSLSSVSSDYLQEGFLASARDQELSTSYTLDMVVEMRDVTGQVQSEVREDMTREERLRAIRSGILSVEEAQPDTGGFTSKVVSMYEGNRHYLFRMRRISDIRLVYAPPSSIGNFGGEVDNWIWPRHTGDFALLRAYVGPSGRPARYSPDNIPYHPRVFFPLSTQGVHEGSFAMIMGFPGRTYRYQEASAVRLAIEQTIPITIDLYKTRIDVIRDATSSDRTKEIQYASKVRRLANTYKKYLAILDGFRRSDLLNLKYREEQAFQSYLDSSAAVPASSRTMLHDLTRVSDRLWKLTPKNLLLSSLTRGVELLGIANRFISYTNAFPQDSLGNPLEPSEQQRDGMRSFVRRVYKDFDPQIDKRLLLALLLKSFTLGTDQHLACAEEIARGDTGIQREERLREFVEGLYTETRLASLSGCDELLAKEKEDILDDPFIRFARTMSVEQSVVNADVYQVNSDLDDLRSPFVKTWIEWKHGSVSYPDANRTLRLTYGQVESLSPRDATLYSFCTTLAGVMEKETGTPPFVVPPKLKDLWRHKAFGGYADPVLCDVPVGFIANLDITGGNSGSPVLNGRGELIGCAFDTNWDGVTGDYLFEERFNRAISVDARYILFVLDKFSGGESIVQEMVIHE